MRPLRAKMAFTAFSGFALTGVITWRKLIQLGNRSGKLMKRSPPNNVGARVRIAGPVSYEDYM